MTAHKDDHTDRQALREELETQLKEYWIRESSNPKPLTDRIITLIDAYTEQRVREKLEKIKTEMRMHTVPEGRDLITRSYLENTIDFEISALRKQQEDT